jgi:DnaD/phage-associated family protein
MPEANGEFVKVYIYLLRTLSDAPVSFSLEQMADHLLCTERDILRALNYWAKVGFLSLDYDGAKHLNGITLCSPEDTDLKEGPALTTAPSGEKAHPNAASGALTEKKPAATASAPKRTSSLTPDRIKELKENEEIVQLLYIAEQYLGKTLTPTEIQKILFFYDELKMTPILIEYLIEYCVSRNHRSIRYMETVALAWSKEGITTIEEAKASTSLYSKDYFTILKAMGISGRNPVESEVSLMDTWLNKYGFSMDIIREACSRTILKTGQPSFQYADRILADWRSHDVHEFKDIQTLDEQHKKKRSEKSPQKQVQPKAASSNRFNNFQQREYNFDEYEKRLLNQ